MLIDELRKIGLSVSHIEADGEMHRCGTDKKPNGKNGWYVAFEDGAAAVFGNWEHGDQSYFWKGDGVTEEQLARIKERREQLQRKQKAERDQVAEQAALVYEHASRDGYSEYLKKKRIYPHGARFDGSTLLIPVQNAQGEITSLQRIYADGAKKFMKGGRISGGYFPIFGRNVSKDERVVLCEGFATGAAIHEATKLPVLVAFNAHNLREVSKAVPFTNLIVAADNDKSGVGEQAAKATGCPYVMPEVQGWDFSDVYLDGRDVASYFKQKRNRGELVAHGLVQEIADWITDTSVRPQPELSLAAALTFVGMVKGHGVQGRTHLRTNLLTLSMAPTGAGKDAPQAAIKRLARVCGLEKHMMGQPTSGAALLVGIEKAQNKTLLVTDEIGRYFSNAMLKSAGGFQREIIDYMIQLFGCANNVFYGKQYANEKMNPQKVLEQPHFCCLGSTVPEKLQEACGSSEVLDGFLNRWLVFKSDLRPDTKETHNLATPPANIVDKVLDLIPEGDLYGNSEVRELSFFPEAWGRLQEYREHIDKKMRKVGHPLDALYSRNLEHVEKVALTVCDNEQVTLRDIDFAIRVVERSNEHILAFANNLADNQNEADYVRVRELVRKHGTISKNILTRSTQWINGGKRRRDEIVEALLESDVMVAQEITNKRSGKKETLYKFTG